MKHILKEPISLPKKTTVDSFSEFTWKTGSHGKLKE
jgi:hypothetical protein